MGKTSYRVVTLALVLLSLVCAPACHAAITIQDAFCRGGQVFLHWSDPGNTYVRYHIYRSDSAINSDDLASAELIDSNASLHSAKDRCATYTATNKGLADPNVGLRITDLGPMLSADDGLRVMTIKAPAHHYYCVIGVLSNGTEDTAVTVGGNSTTDYVDEVLGPPSPVVEESGSIDSYGLTYPYKIYTWYRRDDETLHDGDSTKVTVAFPNADYVHKYSTLLNLHCLNGANYLMPAYNSVRIAPWDFTPGLPWYGNSWWYGYGDHYPDLTTGTVRNYTEKMLLRMMDWAKASLPVDPNRIFLEGGSMGGAGGVSFGLRHPELFAGVSVQVPEVNPGLPGLNLQYQQVGIWGSVATNLPSDEGMGVWDRMNMTAYVTNHKEDLPFLKIQNSKNDLTINWFQTPDFYKALNAGRHAFVAAWAQGGHVQSDRGLPSCYASFNLYGLKLNQSYVVVSNSSANKDPGNGDPLDGDSVGQMNAGLTWTILSDTADQWSAQLTNVLAQPFSADISARRLQSFVVAPGDELYYSIWDAATGGAVRQSGSVTAQAGDPHFVLPQLPLGIAPSKVAVWHRTAQRPRDLQSLAQNDPVDLDSVVVTAVFPDVVYAQSVDRVPALAILGASGLGEGDLIRLKGARKSFGSLAAVQASPTAPSPYGKMALQPFAVPDPSQIGSDGPSLLGQLIKVCGQVDVIQAGWFTVKTVKGSVLVFGTIGTPPADDTYVSVTGICSEATGMNGAPYGIRVRKASDITDN